MYQAEIIEKLKLDLHDSDETSRLWTDDQFKRAIKRSVSEMSRHYPLEAVYEHTINQTVTDEASTAPAAGTYLALTYKPIDPESEVVKSAGGTTYTRDTDYIMDYINGKYTIITAGSITAADTLAISYNKDMLGIDISALISDLIRVVHVEYPTGKVPQQKVAFSIWDDFMYVGSQATGQSQKLLTDESHIAIYYEKVHTPPTTTANGSYAEFMDDVVLVGAAAYSLMAKALQQEHQGVTDLASMRTELGMTTDIHVLIDTALDKVTTYVADMDTALDAAIVQAAASATALAKINSDSTRTYLTDADTALDAFISTIAEAGTALAKTIVYLDDNTNEDSKYWLTKITTDIADLRTKILAAQAATATELGLVGTNSLDKATTGAEAYLDTYDDNINTVNLGADVATVGANYSRARAEIASVRIQESIAYVQEANSRIENLKTYIEQADAWGRVAAGFVNEAVQRIALSNSYIDEADKRLSIADRYLVEASERAKAANAYIGESNGRYTMCKAFIEEAGSRIADVDRYLAEAAQYKEAVNVDMLLSDRFRVEGQSRLDEFHGLLKSRAEYRKRVASVPVRQPA